MKWTRLIPFAVLTAAAPAVLLAQDTTKPTLPPTQTTPQMQQPYGQQNQDSSWAQKRTSALLKGITLSTEQRQKVDSIQAKFKDQLPVQHHGQDSTQRQNDPMRQQQQQPDSAQQSMLLIVLERQDAEIRSALKPDQQKIWDKNKQEWKKNRTPVG